jgi:hypothetical protein
MDRAFWITWYNLPDHGREDYLAWLHGTYIPTLLKRPGYLWAAHYASLERSQFKRRSTGPRFATEDPAVPIGDRYILIFGAADAAVFGHPSRREIHDSLPDAGRNMLAMRTGERVNIMVEATRVEGPEAGNYREGMTTAPWIQFGNFQSTWQDEEDVHAWYSSWRMPAMSRMKGCIRTRRLASIAGWAKQAIIYEFVSLEARNFFLTSHEDSRENEASQDRIMVSLMHAPGSANVARRIWPPVKSEG